MWGFKRMPAQSKSVKRNRGGQKGNQNARKHGFYSSALTSDEICRFWNIVNQESVDPEMAVLRIKLQSLIHYAPVDCRTLKEVTRLIVKWSANKYHLDRPDRACLRACVESVLENYSGISLCHPENLLTTVSDYEKRISLVQE